MRRLPELSIFFLAGKEAIVLRNDHFHQACRMSGTGWQNRFKSLYSHATKEFCAILNPISTRVSILLALNGTKSVPEELITHSSGAAVVSATMVSTISLLTISFKMNHRKHN
jgi:hypothetical protein